MVEKSDRSRAEREAPSLSSGPFVTVRQGLGDGRAPSEIARNLLGEAGQLADRRRDELRENEAGVQLLWRPALMRFELLLWTAEGVYNEWTSTFTGEAPDARGAAVPRIVGRGLQVGHEIATLLHAGYPAGAMARWRTLHEHATIALFLAEADPEMARRYVWHQWIEEERLLERFPNEAFQENVCGLADRAAEVRDLAATARAEFPDPAFALRGGWMAPLVPNRTFAELEKYMGQRARAELFYGFGNVQVHAGPVSAGIQLGNVPGREDHQILGPTFVDLDQTGTIAPQAITALVAALLKTEQLPESADVLVILTTLERATATAFQQRGEELSSAAREAKGGRIDFMISL